MPPEGKAAQPTSPGTRADSQPARDIPADLLNHPRYEILQPLGRGGMGAVYQARHKAMDRIVALKVISSSVLGSKTAVERFQREVKAAAKLHHRNIVTAYDAELDGATHFLVMEYVDGTDLARHLNKQGPLPIADACDFIHQVALGLQHAHEHGMVHRDIKPSNLMLTAGGVVKVMDFGLARLTEEASSSGLTGENVLMGTADYIAPEQAQDAHNADIRSDIYSLGCALFHLLAGRPPFRGNTAVEKISAHLVAQPPLADLPVPGALRAVLGKMLAKDPAQRYQSPAEVAQALAPFIKAESDRTEGSHPYEPRPSGSGRGHGPRPDGRGSSSSGMRRVLIGAAAVALVGLVATPIILRITGKDGGVDQISLQPGDKIETVQPKEPPAPRGIPLDRLHREDIPAYELKVAGGGDPKLAPDSLVAVRGDSRLKHWDGVQSVAFHPAGGLVASGGYDRMVRIWDVETGQEIAALRCTDVIRSIAYSPDGRYLVSGGRGGELKVWNAGTGQVEHELKGHKGNAPVCEVVAFCPDGKRLASAGDDKTLYVWDTNTGKLLFTDTGHADRIISLAYSPDGKRLATGSEDRTIKLWDAAKGGPALATLVGHTDRVVSLAYSPDGKYLVSGGDTSVRLWDANTGQEVRRLIGSNVKSSRPRAVYSPDGSQLAVADWEGTVRLLDVRTAAVKRVLQREGAGSGLSLAFSRDGRRLAKGASDGAVKVWDVETGRPIHTPTGHYGIITKLAISPDQRELASSSYDTTVRLWNLETGRELRSLVGHPKVVHGVAWSLDGNQLFSAGDQDVLRQWNPATGDLVGTFNPAADSSWSLAARPRGQQLAVGVGRSPTTRVVVLDARSHKKIRELRFQDKEPGYVYALAYSPDGKRLAAVPVNGNAKIWDTDSGQEVCAFQMAAFGLCRCIAISPDSMRLAVPSNSRLSVRGLATGEEVLALPYPGECSTVSYSSDGRLLAVCGSSGRLIVFDPANGKQVKAWQLPGEARSVAFDATGRYLLTGNGNGTIYVLRLAEPPISPVSTSAPATRPAEPAKTFTNFIGMEFILVPKGKFWMGGSDGRVGDKQVTIPHDFYLGKYEVTQEEWQKVTGSNPSAFSRTRFGKDRVAGIPDAELKRFPVEAVSWDDAQRFIESMNVREKERDWVYRLPTEAEWEYACRGGPSADPSVYGFDYYFAEPTNRVRPDQANFSETGLQRPCRVGSYAPNRLGLFDMHGNVMEWCADEAPPRPKDPQGASRRIARGGNWADSAYNCRAAHRYPALPSYSGGLGLRLARVPVGESATERRQPPKTNSPPGDG